MMSQQHQQHHQRCRRHHLRNDTKSMMIGYSWPFLISLLLLCWSADAFSSASPATSAGVTTPTSKTSLLLLLKHQAQQRRHKISRNDKIRQTTTSSSTSLHANPIVVAQAVSGAISGGLFAGGLHAVAGPDHLAALLPRCCGQSWWRAGTVGAVWGLGHGISAVAIGTVAFFAKQRSAAAKSLLAINSVTELAVGVSLIIIGLLGIKEAREWDTDDEQDGSEFVSNKSLSAAAVVTNTETLKLPPPVRQRLRAILLNGLLHGFSWDGAPSLAPALAVATWSGNLAFLGAYATGTMVTMAAVTCLIGEGTRRAGRLFPNIPQQLSFGSSIVAIAIGIVWCYLGVKAL